MNVLETMQLGRTDYRISRLGLGCWAIGGHGWGKVDDEDSIRAIQCALDRGVTFFDTADAYGLGKSEKLLAETLGDARSKVVIATKGGVRWDASGKIWTDISPSYLRQAAEASLRRLKLEQIPLYYIHKPDYVTPIEESVATLERMRQEGKIGAIGVANFSIDELLQALAVAPIAAVQVRLNIFERHLLDELLSICRKHCISVIAWGALADGLLTGKFSASVRFSADDHRSRMQQFTGEAFLSTLKRVKWLEQMATDKGRLTCQLALRWLLDYSEHICTLFGAKTERQVFENTGADGWALTVRDMAMIESLLNA